MSLTPSRLRLFLDTADVAQWQQWLPTGIFYGVTTNPLLLERSHLLCTVEMLKTLTQTALALGAQEVQLQTWGGTVADLVQTGKALASFAPQVVVKIPATRMGSEAAAQLVKAEIPVTLTAVFAVQQVLAAEALGATYAAPYLGRMQDLGIRGQETITQMQQVLTGLGSPMRLLVASLRQAKEMGQLAVEGVDTFTLSPAIAATLFDVPTTQAAAEDFERAARGVKPTSSNIG
uniref:transaldolase family protein n=1 Tax=Petrachloros mirabilis TaxID=2918835 RepID=UPI003084445A